MVAHRGSATTDCSKAPSPGPKTFADGDPDIAGLAAAHAYGLAKNHPFIDGDKRASFVACTLFLLLNGQTLPTDDEANIATWLALASGALSEPDLAAWLRPRLRPLG